MSRLQLVVIAAVVWLGAPASSRAQGFYQMGSGSYMTGYGQVHGSFGYAMATQQMYNTMQMNMQRSMMRAVMIKKWGKAAVEKAEADARRGKTTAISASTGPVVTSPPPPLKHTGRFKPVKADTIKQIAKALGETDEERALVAQIVNATKASFEKEVAAKGWRNDVAGAMTFFLVATVTIHHDAPEPSDEAVAVLYETISRSIDDIPEMRKASNKTKQQLYDTLIGFAALPLATFAEGSNNNDASTIATSRALAGQLLQLVMKTDPKDIRFDQGALKIDLAAAATAPAPKTDAWQ